MENTITKTEDKLQVAKDKLSSALSRLDELITNLNSRVSSEKQVRTQVMQELDKHLATLNNVINKTEGA